ncbi:hypothetical protein ACFY8W_11875 [Streptomyces sp. NPDC012637]|uniref:hypothetical protein n=1 Tax=Streptomyces sp. NPDC012637 TaxID=3364842 RepID=UPI0036EF491C
MTTLMATLMKNRPCAKVCVPGPPASAELVVLRQVLGLCLRLSVRLTADCPSHKGG